MDLRQVHDPGRTYAALKVPDVPRNLSSARVLVAEQRVHQGHQQPASQMHIARNLSSWLVFAVWIAIGSYRPSGAQTYADPHSTQPLYANMQPIAETPERLPHEPCNLMLLLAYTLRQNYAPSVLLPKRQHHSTPKVAPSLPPAPSLMPVTGT